MENCTIYYDDMNRHCRQYAESLSSHPNVVCKKMSDYKETSHIYEANRAVGFIYHSGYGQISYELNHIIWRIVLPKDSYIFLLVADGGREMDAIRLVAKELEHRGHQVTNIYSEYFFDRYHVVDRAQKILTDIEKGESIWQKEQERLKKMDRKELRHHLKENMKNYRSYKKRKKNRK